MKWYQKVKFKIIKKINKVIVNGVEKQKSISYIPKVHFFGDFFRYSYYHWDFATRTFVIYCDYELADSFKTFEEAKESIDSFYEWYKNMCDEQSVKVKEIEITKVLKYNPQK